MCVCMCCCRSVDPSPRRRNPPDPKQGSSSSRGPGKPRGQGVGGSSREPWRGRRGAQLSSAGILQRGGGRGLGGDWGRLEAGENGGQKKIVCAGGVVSSPRQRGDGLTAATLLEAEMAPTARVLCRRAFRNILEAVLYVPGVGGKTIAIDLQLCGEEI